MPGGLAISNVCFMAKVEHLLITGWTNVVHAITLNVYLFAIFAGLV